MTFSPSAQQAAFLAAVEAPGPSIVLEAVAGAGKTTTLIEGMRRMKGSVAFMAFNTKIVKEIEAKARERGVYQPSRHTISTVHSLGMRACSARSYGSGKRFEVDERKTSKIARDMIRRQPALEPILPAAVRLCGLAKQALLPAIKEAQRSWAAQARRHGLDDLLTKGLSMRDLVVFAQRILIASNEMRDTVIDFDDMIYLPATFNDYPIRQFDWVLIDEAQDTNNARRVLARKMLRDGGRLCAVGDPWQALYAFTGADSGSLDLIAEEFDAIRLPLSVSYRCPRAVVAEAQKHVGHIEAADDAPEGSVRSLMLSVDKITPETFSQGDAIVCRVNAPIIRLAFSLISRGVPCRVEGRDIGRTLAGAAKRAGIAADTYLKDAHPLLDAWLEAELAIADQKDSETMRRSASDKHGAIIAFIHRCVERHSYAHATGEHLFREIDALFGDDVKGLVLSTIHKAKGREWSRVFWLQAESGGGKRPLKPWEEHTETCCRYVAITRAQDELIYLHMPEVG